MVGATGPVPDSIPLGSWVHCSFIFDQSEPPIATTATSATYGGLYGTVVFDAGIVHLLYDVTLRITNDPVAAIFDYFFSGVTADGWTITHYAYASHASFVPSLALPTVTPSWPPEPDSFAAGYVDVVGVNREWATYSDAGAWFTVDLFTPPAGAPAITQQPVSESVKLGKMAKFDVKASSPTPLFYQWLKDGLPIPDESSRKLIIKKSTAADAGSYSVLLWNDAGVVVSESAELALK